MSYLVLARKSRPQKFSEVVGQQAVVRTLQNGLRQNRVAHAFIFSGVRGTGKTTLARIMAKALNCEQDVIDDPCGTCQSCREIANGTAIDLHEVDGASNRGIQEIRELKENIRFMPTSARFKIIIIDEVHMLTTEAFNALLKTLEEPPEHVYFMFATTELHKVPVTILSRCQRYELKRVAHEELFTHFAQLAGQEGVEIDDQALHLIVREAGGSVRDGLSLLDQVFSYCGNNVTGEEVIEVLGLVSQQVIADMADALLAGDLGRAIADLDKVYTYGMDLKRFVNELLSWFRGLVICSVSKNPRQLLDMPADDFILLQKTAAAHSRESLSLVFHLLMDGLEKAALSARPRFAVEMAFIKVVQASDVLPVTELLGRLDTVLEGVVLPEARSSSLLPEKNVQEKNMAPEVVAVDEVRQPAELVKQPEQEQPDPSASIARVATEIDVVSRPEPVAESEPVSQAVTTEEQQDIDKTEQVAVKKDVRSQWPAFVTYVGEREKWMKGALRGATSACIEGDELVILYEDSVNCRIFQEKKKQISLTEYAMDFFQQSLKIRFEVPDSSGCVTDPDSGEALQQDRLALANDPLVVTACEIFNGQVGDIRVGPRFRKSLQQHND